MGFCLLPRASAFGLCRLNLEAISRTVSGSVCLSACGRLPSLFCLIGSPILTLHEVTVDEKPKICSICMGDIDVHRFPGSDTVWRDGHNAQPVNDGRCCTGCNDTVVIPARLRSIYRMKENALSNN